MVPGAAVVLAAIVVWLFLEPEEGRAEGWEGCADCYYVHLSLISFLF